jgi:hypothetical protein
MDPKAIIREHLRTQKIFRWLFCLLLLFLVLRADVILELRFFLVLLVCVLFAPERMDILQTGELDDVHFVKVLCRDCKHADWIVLRGMPVSYTEMYCGLLDGSSPLFVKPPKDDHGENKSMIGRCAACNGSFDAKLVPGEQVPDEIKAKYPAITPTY